MDQQWLAAYLYYADGWETFLPKAVKPFVDNIMAEGLAQKHFFIRYWEKGPHIRLRFYGDPTVLEQQVKPRLIEHFTAYMQAHPSTRGDEDFAETPEERGFFPNNTIQFIDYEPETPRYGGPVGLVHSETHFMDCSNAILAILADADSWSYDTALGAAIQMHLSFAHGLGLNPDQLHRMLLMVFHGWLGRAYNHHTLETDEARKEAREEVMTSFDKMFDSQKEVLLPFCQALWGGLNQGAEFDSPWLNQWIAAMKRLRTELEAAHSAGDIVIPAHYTEWRPDELKEDREKLFYIYESYVHMINNRLGIMNQDEAYLGYLIRGACPFLEEA